MNGNQSDRVEVAAGIIWKHGLFLAAQQPEGKPYAGYWMLPGGKLESRETPEEALCRELAEELGINVRRHRLLKILDHDYSENGLSVRLYFFDVLEYSGEPCPREEQNMRWISADQARDLDFLPGDAKILNEIASPSA